jgi:hypothetical protein
VPQREVKENRDKHCEDAETDFHQTVNKSAADFEKTEEDVASWKF